MPRYIVTKTAGPYVAGLRNPGAGKILDLTERQAAHELRLGSLVPSLEVEFRAAMRPHSREDAMPLQGLTEPTDAILSPETSEEIGHRRSRRRDI